MTGKADAEFKKIFQNAATEKVIASYKCSLYLDLHHPGKLFVTTSAFFFYTTKNLDASMPNPFAISSSFKEVDSLEKNGLDGIMFKKSGEEIILDSFQFRNEAFATLHRKWAEAKGKSLQPDSSNNSKPEFPPLDVQTKELCSRSLDGLPFFEDLGLLSLNYLIKTSSNSIFSGQDAKDKSNVERAKLLILSLGDTLDSSFDKSKIESKFDEFFKDYESRKNSFDPLSLREFLKKEIGENSNLIRCLKACIHPITTGVERIKSALTSHFPTKDKDWKVEVTVKDSIEVLHVRNEQSSKGTFEIEWKMGMTFDKGFSLQNVWLNVTDLKFDTKTREPIRYEIQNLLKDLLPIYTGSHKGAILLPSFADFSNQQLTSIPPEILKNTSLQTLYLHCNQLSSLPPEITQLQQLQVLYLNQNKFQTFPNVATMTHLSELHLGMNQVSTIPPEISQLKNLRELSFSYNALKQLPVTELLSLTNLRKLYLHNNYLETIPLELADLPNLKSLQIHNNRLKGELQNFGPHDGEDVVIYLKEHRKK